MKWILVGDTHGDIDAINSHVMRARMELEEDPDVVVQVGDFGFNARGDWPRYRCGERSFLVPTYVIHGNHDRPDETAPVMGPTPQIHIPNLRVFESGEIVDISGIRVLAVGGAASINPKGNYYPFSTQEYADAQRRWNAIGSPEIDLLITHEAPAYVGLEFKHRVKEGHVGSRRLRNLWQAVKPKLQVNGHHHVWNLHIEDGLSHLSLPRGNREFAILDTTTWAMTLCPKRA